MQQTSEPSFPNIVWLAISKQGVIIIHPKTKVKVFFLCFNSRKDQFQITKNFGGFFFFLNYQIAT